MAPENVSSDKKLSECVTRLREAAGANLVTVILFGSAAAGDYHPEFSNLNLFCVVRDSSFAALQARGDKVVVQRPFTSADSIMVTPEGFVGAADPRTRGALAVGF